MGVCWGSGLFLKKDSLCAVGRFWAGCTKNHLEEFAKNTDVRGSPTGCWEGPRRQTPGWVTLGIPLLQWLASLNSPRHQALPGDCMSHSRENHQAHSQLVATKCMEGRAEGWLRGADTLMLTSPYSREASNSSFSAKNSTSCQPVVLERCGWNTEQEHHVLLKQGRGEM